MAEQTHVTISISRKTKVGDTVYFGGTRVVPASDAKAIVDAGNGTIVKAPETVKTAPAKENK